MKKIITIATVAALVLGLGVVAYAANNTGISQPETTQGETIPAEVPQMNGEAPSDFPEMNGQPPQMNGEAPSDLPEMNGQLPQMNGEAPSDLPEMNGQPPQINGEKPSDIPELIDFDEMVTKGVISQETCDKIKAYMEENKPANLPEMNGQAHQMDGQAPEMNGQPPQTDGQTSEGNTPPDRPELPEMKGEAPVKEGLLNDLLSNGIITQIEYDALSEAITK